MEKRKKLGWADVGGCGGSIFRSHRSPDHNLRFDVHPEVHTKAQIEFGGRHLDARLVVSVQKPGTVSVYLPIVEKYFPTKYDAIDYANKIVREMMEIEYTPEEQQMIDEVKALKEKKQKEYLKSMEIDLKMLPLSTVVKAKKTELWQLLPQGSHIKESE